MTIFKSTTSPHFSGVLQARCAGAHRYRAFDRKRPSKMICRGAQVSTASDPMNIRQETLLASYILGFWLKGQTAKGSRKNKLAFWRERRVGRCKAPRRRRCGDIVEERQRRRCLPTATPRRTSGSRLLASASGFSLLTRTTFTVTSCIMM